MGLLAHNSKQVGPTAMSLLYAPGSVSLGTTNAL